jgi:hypothetical protein
MSHNYLILLIVIEPLLLYLFAYSTKMARKWANNKLETCEELSSELPALSRKLRKELRLFNYSIKKRFIIQPLAMAEITSILGEIGTEFIKSRMPMFSANNKFMFVPIIIKLWKLRHRIVATLTQKTIRTAY